MFFKNDLPIAALMLAASAVHSAPPKALAPELLDWQVYSEQPVGEVCRGYYLAPELDLPEAHLPIEQARLFAAAQQLNYSAQGGLLMQGEVNLRKGSLYLTSDQASLNAARDYAKLKGNISVRQQGLLLRGAEGDYQLEKEELQMSEAHYVVHEQRLRGSAWTLEQGADGIVTLRDSSMTSCSPGDNAWRLVAGKLKLNRDTGFGDATNVRMEILKVPVFYWPWLRFPIDDRRHTGLLSPSISWSKTSGLDYQQPFYWNIAPNVDATFYPRQIDKRGFMLGGELRYLTERSSGEIYYARLNEDKEFADLDRWNFAAKHQGRLTSQLNYQINYSQVSDDLYLKDLNTNTFTTSDTELLQQLSFNYAIDGWRTRLNFQGYQKLNTANNSPETPYQLFDFRSGRKAGFQDYYRLPQLEVRKTTRWNNVLQSSLLVDLTQFSKLFDKELGGYKVTGLTQKPGTNNDYYFTSWGAPDTLRLHLEPSLNAEWRWPWAYIRPAAKVKFNQYRINPYWAASVTAIERNNVELDPSALVPVFSLDTGLFLERDTGLFGKKLVQTLEPRAFFAYVPFVEQYDIPNFFDGGFVEDDYGQLFRAERTTGQDRVGDVKKLTLGVTQRLISQNTGRELGSLGVAKAIYLEDRRIDNSYLHPDHTNRADNKPREDQAYKNVRTTSNLAVQASLTLTKDLKLSSSLMWDDYFHKTENSNTYLTYTGIENSQFNLGHSYTSNYNLGFKGPRPDKNGLDAWSYLQHAEEQVYASMIYALNEHWRVFAKQGHDLKRSEKLDSITGLEYNSCCWQIQLVYRDWVDNPDTSPGYQGAASDNAFEARERDYGVFLNVVFKGLGGVGQPIPQLLSEEVQGYTDRP
ncbi:LPS-assembly protein LptD [Marinospirillum insulare]|nr:LPS assembly protein LptD [Marinospirillum insulare]